MARQRRHQQHARLLGLDVLPEVQQRAERRDMRGLLAHLHLAVADADLADAEGRPCVGQAGARDQLAGRREVRTTPWPGMPTPVSPNVGPRRRANARTGPSCRTAPDRPRTAFQVPCGVAAARLGGPAPSQLKKALVHFMLHCEIISRADRRTGRRGNGMAQATLTISSKNYASWSLRGWLLCKMAGLEFEEVMPRRRSVDAGGVAAAVAVVPRAVPRPTTGSRSGTRWRLPNT